MKRFTYSIDGRMYFLNPEFKRGPTGRIWVIGCEMYDKENEYVGYWHRHNIPVNLIRDMTRHVKMHDANTPTETQTVRGYQRRKPKR